MREPTVDSMTAMVRNLRGDAGASGEMKPLTWIECCALDSR